MRKGKRVKAISANETPPPPAIRIGPEYQSEIPEQLSSNEELPEDRIGEPVPYGKRQPDTPPGDLYDNNPTFGEPPKRRRTRPKNRGPQIGPDFLWGDGNMYPKLTPPE